jgi:hypothetical protein
MKIWGIRISPILDQLIFFYPIWIFYLPDDAITGSY